jgi:hypothetical protein
MYYPLYIFILQKLTAELSPLLAVLHCSDIVSDHAGDTSLLLDVLALLRLRLQPGWGLVVVDISYAQLKYERFRKRTEYHYSILPGVFQLSLFIFCHRKAMVKEFDN